MGEQEGLQSVRVMAAYRQQRTFPSPLGQTRK
jgi:hypothetical protein